MHRCSSSYNPFATVDMSLMYKNVSSTSEIMLVRYILHEPKEHYLQVRDVVLSVARIHELENSVQIVDALFQFLPRFLV